MSRNHQSSDTRRVQLSGYYSIGKFKALCLDATRVIITTCEETNLRHGYVHRDIGAIIFGLNYVLFCSKILEGIFSWAAI